MKLIATLSLFLLLISCSNQKKIARNTTCLEIRQESSQISDIITHITELSDLQLDFKIEEKRDTTGNVTKITTGSLRKKDEKKTDQTAEQTTETKSAIDQQSDNATTEIKEKPIPWGWIATAIIAICVTIILLLIKKKSKLI